MEDTNLIIEEIEKLISEINRADEAYYKRSAPIISDDQYDKLLIRLEELEKTFPLLKRADSPTLRVGSDISNQLPEVEHLIPVLSLEKAYNLSELNNWINRSTKKIVNNLDIIVEPKIDGAGVVLYYESGQLVRALTRGDGHQGNDITENIKTIRNVPLNIEYKGNLAVRGEVYIENAKFNDYNEEYCGERYANPRNLASGTIRRLKSSEAASVPLDIFVYEGFFIDDKDYTATHFENLCFLKQNGFRITDKIGIFTDNQDKYSGSVISSSIIVSGKNLIANYIELFRTERTNLKYDIDGLVLKIDSVLQREELGYTRHHPRWAIAYKFGSISAETNLLDIEIQIGRGGRITPVAILEPVELMGSVISRATLHNQEYIKNLNINIGDRVLISKRGDVIPAVESVIKKTSSDAGYFHMPDQCPSCCSKLLEDGAHLFCVNTNCDKKLLGTLQFFVGRKQMDIETLGDKTLEFLFEKGFVRKIPDIYNFDYKKLIDFEGFKDKKIQNIIRSVNNSKQKDFKITLASLGLKDIGFKVSDLLVKYFKTIDNIIKESNKRNPAIFYSIDGIGETLADVIINTFTDQNVVQTINSLKIIGLNFADSNTETEIDGIFKDTKWVITGSFVNYKPRDLAAIEIQKRGGSILSTVSTKTDFLLCGSDAGSKLDKAKELGIKIVYENDFIHMINQ